MGILQLGEAAQQSQDRARLIAAQDAAAKLAAQKAAEEAAARAQQQAAFIANSRTDIEWLVGEVERLLEDNERMR